MTRDLVAGADDGLVGHAPGGSGELPADDVVPVAEGLFTWSAGSAGSAESIGSADSTASDVSAGSSGEIRLIGSACRRCGTVTFPAQGSCPRCTGVDVEERLLATRGTLWTYTVQRFPPKEPYRGDVAGFRPYAVGYVELPDGVLVESRLVVDDVDEPGALRIGQAMELVAEPVFVDEHGRQVVTFAFAPTGAGS
jgi:uncharacterized OB-fold protein